MKKMSKFDALIFLVDFNLKGLVNKRVKDSKRGKKSFPKEIFLL